MKKTEIAAMIQPSFAARLRALDDGELGNGTPIADAVATVLALDMTSKGVRVAREAEKHICTIDDDVLTRVIADFRHCLANRNTTYDVELPFGTVMRPSWQPGVKVGPNHYVPLRGMPGLHETGTAGDPDRPGATLLRREIALALASLPSSDVPRPGADDIVIESNGRWRDTLQVPMRGGPGVTFQYRDTVTMTEIMLDIDIALEAAAVRERALDNLKASSKVDKAYARTIAEIQPLLDKAERDGTPFRFVGVHVDVRNGTTTVRPKFEVLGNDLKTTTWEAWGHSAGGLTGAIASQLGIQRRRKRILDQSGNVGARGRIDQITLNAIRALTSDPAELLRRIAQQRNVTIQAGRNGKRTDPVRLAWRDGRVESCFAITDKATWNYSRIIFKGIELPEAVIITLKGKPVSTLVDHPYLAGDNRIRSISGRAHWLYANLDVEWTVFDAETGETIDADATVPDEAGQEVTADERPRQGDLLEMLG